MDNLSLYTKLNSLPRNIQMEISDYMEFLIEKHKNRKNRPHPKPGCMKGTFEMKDDFDAPLDDFKDYM